MLVGQVDSLAVRDYSKLRRFNFNRKYPTVTKERPVCVYVGADLGRYGLAAVIRSIQSG
jgi:hypothetical protein